MGKKSNENDEEDKLLVTMDAVSDERAWCMFVSSVLPKAVDAVEPSEWAATIADKMLVLFKARFRQDEPEFDKGDEDGEDDEEDDEDEDEK